MLKSAKAKRRTVDIGMTVLLFLLMAHQVTGDVMHEWIGIAMTVLVIVHQILNRKWYSSLFKGKYNAYRTVTTAVNVLLLLSFALTAFSGMAMSGHAVPFLQGMISISLARRLHLAMSHWSFVLMGLHLGLHIPAMAKALKLSERTRKILTAVFLCLGGFGLHFFLQRDMLTYMSFKDVFAFLDHEKAGALVLLENVLMLITWAFLGTKLATVCRMITETNRETEIDE